MNKKLIVRISPHLFSGNKTQRIMLDVIIALMPTCMASCFLFGMRALWVTVVSVISCVVFEYIVRKMMKKENSIQDLSAVITGILLAFCVPVGLPLYMVVLGAFVAIVIVKQMFGGLGQNFVNPAMAARIVLVISFAVPMTTWIAKGIPSGMVDMVSGATPLALVENGQTVPRISDLLLGRHGGCIGETCALTLLIGGIYLRVRNVITLKIPVAYLATAAICALLAQQNPLVHILSGGMLLGAIFMATDYATSPCTEAGKIVFGIGCGLVTMAIRLLGMFPEGVSFAVVFMNLWTPHIERWTRTKAFGEVQA